MHKLILTPITILMHAISLHTSLAAKTYYSSETCLNFARKKEESINSNIILAKLSRTVSSACKTMIDAKTN